VPGYKTSAKRAEQAKKRSGPEELIPGAEERAAGFRYPAHLMPTNFWSNLKQFLLERPV